MLLTLNIHTTSSYAPFICLSKHVRMWLVELHYLYMFGVTPPWFIVDSEPINLEDFKHPYFNKCKKQDPTMSNFDIVVRSATND